jgi:hypothetical protein
LFPLVYDALRALGAAKLAEEARGQTLQATALVDEVYLKLVETKAQQWNSRGHSLPRPPQNVVAVAHGYAPLLWRRENLIIRTLIVKGCT